MTAAFLVTALVQVRTEFNALSPKRDTGSDGWIGDAAHQDEVSDHNPDSQGRVLAVDIDSTGPWPTHFDTYVEYLVARQRSGADDRLEYVIWNRRIASRSSKWIWKAYSGTNDPHTGHAHFSARHDHVGNTSGRTWGLNTIGEDIVTPEDIAAIAAAVWATAGGGPGGTREKAFDRLAHVDAQVDELATTDQVQALEAKVDGLLALLSPQPEG